MNTAKLDLNAITGREMISLGSSDVDSMYKVLFDVADDEAVRSPYEVDRDKTVYRTHQQVHLKPSAHDKGTYQYDLNSLDGSKGKNVMDLASKVFLQDTFPAIKVREDYAATTRIRHCRYPGHVKIESAHLFHGTDHAQVIDAIRLNQYAEFELPREKREFYRRMVGDSLANTTWTTKLPSFAVSVPQPWYFCIIPGAELRLNCEKHSTLTYSFREEATATLEMQILENDEWKDVNPSDYEDRIDISKVNAKKNSVLELHVVLHKCHENYASNLLKSSIKIPYDDMIIMDSVSDSNTHEININTFDFIRRICILIEPKANTDKSIYKEAIVSGKLEYKGGLCKVPEITPSQMLLNEPWTGGFALPDREGFYMLTFSDHNRPGSYDTAMSLGGTGSKLTLVVDKSGTYNVRVRLYFYKMVIYSDNNIQVISSLNAKNFVEGVN